MPSQPDSELTFSCRIYGVLRQEDQVLMTKSHFLERHFINFPGGGVNIGEAPIEALHREFREETGLKIKPLRVLYASEAAHLSTQRPIQIVSVYWLVESVSGKLNPGGNGDDVLSLFWAPLKNIPMDMMFPSDLEFAKILPRLIT
jgi:8-oxo-dGTP pyrophosphatase MutT (NUDIX family)